MTFVILLLIPALGYSTYLWLISVVNEEIAELEVTAKELCSQEFADIWANSGLSGTELALACEPIRPIFWLGEASLWAGAASTIFIFAIFSLSAVVGTSRRRLAAIFAVLVPVSLLFVSLATVVQGGILTYSLYAIQVNSMEAWYPVVTLGIGFGALVVALSVVRAAFSINRKVTMSQMAINADQEDYPELWSFVRTIAEKVAAPLPNNIVIGLEPNFYATSANVRVLSNDSELSGETLYVSLPLMRLFSNEEFAAVVGHELGHFKGEDVQYTMKFAPLYRALSLAVQNAATQERIMAIPAISVLSFLLERFARSEREISRQREFEADIIGANATSPDALGSALVKITAFTDMWSELTYEVIENLEYGRPVTNLSKLYASKVAFDSDAEASEKVIQENLDHKISHPTDSHPTLSDRLNNIGVNPLHLKSLRMGMSDSNSHRLVKQAEDLEVELSIIQQKIFQVTGYAAYETMMPENAETIYGVARVIQTAAAKMVCADGVVQPSEIAEAEDKGKKLIPHFNSLEFRELCLAPEKLPDTAGLRKSVKDLFSEENLSQLTDFLHDIASADGNVSKEEKQLIRALQK